MFALEGTSLSGRRQPPHERALLRGASTRPLRCRAVACDGDRRGLADMAASPLNPVPQEREGHPGTAMRWRGLEPPRGINPTRPSTLRVYQFRHQRARRIVATALDRP